MREALARLTRVDGDCGETPFDGNITFYSWDQWLRADKHGELDEWEEACLTLGDGSWDDQADSGSGRSST